MPRARIGIGSRVGMPARFAAVASAVAVFASIAVAGNALAQDAGPAPAAPAAKGKHKHQKPDAANASGPQQAQDAAAPKDPAVALAAYTAGVKAYQAGKFEAAVQSLNGAVQGGGLTSSQLAKALYYRGAAYQQLGKSGQAISDLTSALWFKDGLDATDRAEATKHRAAAYRDAGLTDQGLQTASAAQPSTSDKVAETGSLSVGTGAAASPGPSLGLNASPSEPASSSSSSPLGGIGNLFGNLFGGSSSSSQSAPAPTAEAQPAPVPQPTASAEPEVLPWANKTASLGTPASDAAPAAAPAASQKPAKAAAKPGTYRIQVAAVKTRDEASAIISKLQGLGGTIAEVPSAVDETTFGTMGKFFRVRIGPFADAAATKAPCEALKKNGLDCLVTSK